ncbi:unspecific monooxygenase [Nocardioides ginsengisegetis]|uniref:Unspecific monooxygenase n=1 Tax=Nocardioides ginsengisegetis TaxID=661491 RepID=A0A7W3J1C9_9ACTN|nr:cytochrome P450 [Nocardioides ginsengisegetis]MBA8804425.1 unspecific monooxygenase [Nocardioides ginsengisegetis]
MRNDWSGQVLPHPPGRRRIVGDVGDLRPDTAVQTIMQRAASYRPLLEQHVFRTKFVFVTGAGLCAELCDEQRFEKALPPALEALREFAGDGLFTAHNDEPTWQLAHDLLMPAFTRPAMQRYHGVMLEAVRELFEVLPDDRPVDVATYMTKLTMETIARAAFSHDFGSFTQVEPHPFVPAMVTALETGRRMGALSSLPGSGIVRRRLRRRNAGQQAYIDTMLDDLIAERRAGARTPGAPDDLLGIMLEQAHPETGERLSDRAIRYQILTFLVAGHETTSGALTFALHYLAKHPQVLAAARAETDAILGSDPDAEPTFEQVAKFRYLRRVLDESLRLWPTAPGFARSPRETTTVGGYRMRPQDWAIVLLPMVHRDPAVWGEDAEEFDPDRFLPERSKGRLPHSYKPFGTGERACIGRQFALHEAVLVLARLVHRFDLAGDPAYELKVTERLTMMPRGLELTLRPRVVQQVGA